MHSEIKIKNIFEIEDHEIVKCRECYSSTEIYHFKELGEFYCNTCAKEELVEEEERDLTYNELCSERNRS